MKKDTNIEVTKVRRHNRIQQKQFNFLAPVVFTLALLFTGESTGSAPTNHEASWCGGFLFLAPTGGQTRMSERGAGCEDCSQIGHHLCL